MSLSPADRAGLVGEDGPHTRASMITLFKNLARNHHRVISEAECRLLLNPLSIPAVQRWISRWTSPGEVPDASLNTRGWSLDSREGQSGIVILGFVARLSALKAAENLTRR